jgi:hypothetical protein
MSEDAGRYSSNVLSATLAQRLGALVGEAVAVGRGQDQAEAALQCAEEDEQIKLHARSSG